MRRALVSILSLVICMSSAFAESFLTAQSFPKTFDDVSFKEKFNLMEDSYQPYQSEYDRQTGVCIKNCTYPGLTLKQEQEISDKDTKAALAKSEKYENQNKKLSVDTQSIISNISGNKYSCLNRNPNIQVNQKVPKSEPLMGYPRITSPYGPRVLNGKQGYHDGIDYSAAVGTIVYAPADGKVVNVWSDSTCGKGLKLEHADGTKTLYCHLNNTFVTKGSMVGAGCPIAQTGNTGHSTGPHLHYAIQDTNGHKIDPSDYTKRSH